ncbi:MAG TPA: TIR domain-containing protein [Pyrinomonadaceae bacterium]|nr:TIR domain-containing protein [Pyrinomonadaceae bacterium]
MPHDAEKKPTVFISYSHKDEEWKDRLVTHLGVLQNEGLLDLWEDRRIAAGDEWYAEIEEAMNAASVAIMLVSANFLNSKFILTEEVPSLLQQRAEKGVRVFPVIIKPFAWETVGWLRRLQLRPKDGRPLSAGNENQIDTDLAAIATEIYLLLRSATDSTKSREFVPLPPEKISVSRLPTTGPNLFGRKLELEMLDGAWADFGTNVLSLVAWGGVGKSALVNHWLRGMRGDNYRGAERVYAWSFYRQGTSEQVSADQFIESSLKWFGDHNPSEGNPWDKGERLAQLIRAQPTLLLLDGLEPLQTPPGQEGEGKLKDQAMQALLRELAAHNPGLCLISTRLVVTDLADFEGSTFRQINLEHLAPQAGAEILKAQGVGGSEVELEQASREFGGHSLALTLLGSYLSEVYGGDIRRRGEVGSLEEDVRYGGHAQRVMAAYEKWFGEESAELNVLRMLGLFDRPADESSIAALRAAPAIPGLTHALQPMTEAAWQQTLGKLRRARLVAERDKNQPGTLDAHPLVREHFRNHLKQNHPDAWREGNDRLYEHLKNTTKEFPDTVEELAPLYAAVAHACAAGRHQEALNEVYYRRICREQGFFSINKLGAFGADLSALGSFFDPPWQNPVPELTDEAKSFILNHAGLCLRALGRLTEAVQPLQAGLEARIPLKDWGNASISAGNLSQLYLALGDLRRAVAYAEQHIELADKSGGSFDRIIGEVTLADALFQAGRLLEAEAVFHQAELMQEAYQPQYPLLYSLQGFLYCNLLLEQGKYQEVKSRASQTLREAKQQLGLLDIALDLLSLGRAYMLQAQDGKTSDYAQATDYLNQAVDGLRLAGTLDDLPRGLLARSELHNFKGDFSRARADLDEAMSIIVRGEMRLYEADCHLGYARLYVAQGEKERARESWEKAKEMVERMDYGRRKKDVEEIGRELGEVGGE